MSTQTKRTNAKYTLEFKQDAARLVNEKGYTHQQVVDHLGVSLSAIGRWSRAERRPIGVSPGRKATSSLSDQSELMRLRRENEQLRMEREIIKKAAAPSSLPRKSDEVRVYSRAAEDVSSYRAMSRDGG